jgi:DNA-binding Lrp family transcriptional regulator
MKQVDETSRKIIRLAQGDLPLDPRPYDSWARQLGMEPAALNDRLRGLMAEGIVRGVKAVLRHRAAGFSFGAMVCWAVPEQRYPAGRQGDCRQEKVSHCYERRASVGTGFFP